MRDERIEAEHLRIIATRLGVQPGGAVGAVDNLREDYGRMEWVLRRVVDALGLREIDVAGNVATDVTAGQLGTRLEDAIHALQAENAHARARIAYARRVLVPDEGRTPSVVPAGEDDK